MTATKDVKTTIVDILATQLDVDEVKISPTSTIEQDLGADSLDQVEIVMALEEEFDLEIPDEDAQRLRTVSELTTYIEQRLVAKR